MPRKAYMTFISLGFVFFFKYFANFCCWYVLYIGHFCIEEFQFCVGVWHSCCMHVERWAKFFNHFQLEACECKIAATGINCFLMSFALRIYFSEEKQNPLKHWKILLLFCCCCLNCYNADVCTSVWNCIPFSISQPLQKWSPLDNIVFGKVRYTTSYHHFLKRRDNLLLRIKSVKITDILEF